MMMKKRILAALIVASALMMTACGNAEGEQESVQNTVGTEQEGVAQGSTYLKDMDLDKYITVGEYKGMEVNVEKRELQQKDVELEYRYMLSDVVTAESGAVTDRAIVDGDLINLDFAGYKDGVAFSGGTAAGQLLGIGSGQFIDGFEAGLVGVKPGETVDLNLTFPENYGNEELNGAAVVFTVTVNYIIPGKEESSDEKVQELAIPDVTTREQLYAYVEDYLKASLEQEYSQQVENAVLTKFLEECTFIEMPAERLEADKAQTTTNLENQAAAYGMDAATFTQYFYGMELDAFVDMYTESVTQQLIAMQAVANKEGLGITDEELNSMLTEYATAAGVDSIDEYRGNIDLETYREYFMYDKVLNFLVENATITN